MVDGSAFRNGSHMSDGSTSPPCPPLQGSRSDEPSFGTNNIPPHTNVKKKKKRAGRKAQEEKLRRLQRQADGTSSNGMPSGPNASNGFCRAHLYDVEIRDTPQSGQKLFATKDIKRGVKVISETPLLVLGQKDSFRDLLQKVRALNDQEVGRFHSMRQLPDADTKIGRETVLWLSEEMQVVTQSEGQETSDEEFSSSVERAYLAVRIFAANMLSITNPDVLGEEPWWEDASATKNSTMLAAQSAVFEIIGMIEHSCRPSCCYTWNKAHCIGVVHAARDIRAGEELTISHLRNLCIPRDIRRNVLREERSIDECKCNVCASYITVGEDRRLKLLRLSQEWESPESTYHPGMPLHAAKQMMALMKLEGLDTSLQMVRRLYQVGAAAYRVCNFDEAKTYFEDALNVARACLGGDNPDYHDIAHELKLAKEDAKHGV